MKRKIIYGLLITLGALAVYFGLRLGFGLFTPYNTFTAKRDVKNGNVQIIALGLPLNPKAEQKLAS